MANWLPVVGREGSHEVSDAGQVNSLPRTAMRSNGSPLTVRGGLLAVGMAHGYRTVNLSRDEWPVKISVLMLEAFVGPKPFPEAEARHLNDVSDDDRIENLKWGTHADNMADKDRNGTGTWLFGDAHPGIKLSDEQIAEIRRRYTGVRGEQVALAREFGVSKSLVNQIVLGKARGQGSARNTGRRP